jgi:hypothetical protein
MREKKQVSEALVFNSTLTDGLISRDFNAVSFHESLKHFMLLFIRK